MQKNLILITPVFVVLILFNLGYAAWRDGRQVHSTGSWTPAAISTVLPASATPTPGWWASGSFSTPTGTPTRIGNRTK
jgi:hypothetical protein